MSRSAEQSREQSQTAESREQSVGPSQNAEVWPEEAAESKGSRQGSATSRDVRNFLISL